MSTQVFTNLRKRTLCTLDASDVVMSASGKSPANLAFSPTDLKNALNVAPYESATQRSLQTLRLLGRQAPEQESDVTNQFGVVVEFGAEQGVDVLAAYSDGVAAWFDASSRTFIEASLNSEALQACQSLISAGLRIREITGAPSWDSPPPPSAGFACISLINASGISFGLGPMRELASDGYGGPVIHWALNLRTVLMAARTSVQPKQS